LIALGVAVVAIASTAGVAMAASATLGTSTVEVKGKTETVVVDSRGVTLYTLSGDGVGDLKCVTNSCLGIWPPYQVSATAELTKAKGVNGTLSELHLINANVYQVMLNGHPLYRFAPDSGSKGSALGEGITSFGGIWHVVAASLGSAPGQVNRAPKAASAPARGNPAPREGSAPARRQPKRSPALPMTPVLLVFAALGVATISLSYARTRARARRARATAPPR
jgi:predicted lipoprotein with Yx(FWY)xxD motif